MKFKKICFSTELSELYGRDSYQSHIEIGREYWYYFSRELNISEGWRKIKVTYIRSGCMFYIFSDYPEVKERFCPLNCFMASKLVFADIDPMKDLDNFVDDINKKLYCFDSEHTIIHNWPNDREVEIDSDDSTFLLASVLLKEVK
ncbi:MAG: hypothetical protein J6T10_13030 [Methanobrevibacter sp.]|nr:hypothetical protein [Methanobrevibacter sp.]